MKTHLLASLCLVAGSVAFGQASALDIDPPTPTNDQPVYLSQSSPLTSLEQQVRHAGFDQRSAFLTAFDQANLAVDSKLAELRARGLTLSDEAITQLDYVRLGSRQKFRDMSLTTVETFQTARDNALSALRQLRGTLEALEKTAIQQAGAS